MFFPVSVFSSSFLTIDPNFLGDQSSSFTHVWGHLLKSWKRNIWVFPKIGVPLKHPKMIIFSRKTHGCWGNPPFLETSISPKAFHITRMVKTEFLCFSDQKTKTMSTYKLSPYQLEGGFLWPHLPIYNLYPGIPTTIKTMGRVLI